MADDITKPSRSSGTGQDNGRHEVDEDPLVKLARIVSEDGSFFHSEPGKPAVLAEPRTISDPFSADLEAELMEQFEASFSSETSGVADTADAGETEPAAVARSDSEQPGYTAGDSLALGKMAIEADVRSEKNVSADYERSPDYDADAVDARTGSSDFGDQAGIDFPADQPPDYSQTPTIESAVEPIGDPYRAAPDEAIAGAMTGELHSRSFETEFTVALADTASPSIAEDFTPEFGVEAYGRDPELRDSLAGDDYPGSHYYAGPVSNGDGNVDDDYEGGTAMPPPVAADSGGRKGLIAVVGVVAVVVLGGGVAAYIGNVAPRDPATPTPVIKAESGAVKIKADTTDTAGAAPSVLDPLAGQQAKSEEKLIDRIEEPQQIARVVLPGPVSDNTTPLTKPVGNQAETPSGPATDPIGKTIDRVMQESGQPAAAPKYDPIGPRKVRTVVVKPDGSIVSGDNAATQIQPTLPVQPAPPALPTMEVASVNPAQSPEPKPVKTTEINSSPADGETLAGSGDAASATIPPPAPLAATKPAAPVIESEKTGQTGNAVQAKIAPAGTMPRPKPAKAPDVVVARAPSTQAAPSPARSAQQPVNLLAAPAEADQPRVTASTAPTGPAQSGYVVQVSSQRSADQAQAAFADMQRRYKSVLGGFQANIQRADLGDKGTYYRVRVGPMASRQAALRICEQLKSAGGSCFVTQ